MMVVDNKFSLGDMVYLKTDPDQCVRIVTGMRLHPNGLLYILSIADKDSDHYDFEITVDKSVLV